MKMKKMIAAVLTAALVAAGTGLTGLAADPFFAETVFDTPEVDDAAGDTAMISLLSETVNESDSNAKLKGGLELKMPFNVNVIDAPHSSSSSSDEGGSYSASSTEPEPSGGWEAGEKGWWYSFKDGTYPSNGWKMLEWQGKASWYYFDAEGYMVSGWLTDTDGKRYFLHDKMDGTQGYMYTGWHEIGGKWYYFSEAEGGPFGSLLVNATTPDGYQVGADGAWIP